MILPTVIILLLTLAIMTTVIPYAFHVVIKQLQSHYGDDENSKAQPLFKELIFCHLFQFVMMRKLQAVDLHSFIFHHEGTDFHNI